MSTTRITAVTVDVDGGIEFRSGGDAWTLDDGSES